MSALFLAGCHKPAASGGDAKPDAKGQVEATNVSVATVGTASISKSLSVTGNLDTLSKTILSAKTTGRLIMLAVREGDRVKQGQVIAQLDPTEIQANVAQYQAAVLNAQVKVVQATTQYKQSITNAHVAVTTAQSQVEAANVNLQKVTAGDRPEVKQQSQDQLMQQQANYDNANTNYQRQLQLYKQGAIAKADLDNAETTFKVQSALLDSYKQAAAASQKGGRPEDISAAQQTLRQAQLSLNNALANQANVQVNRDAIVAAQAAVAQARAQLAAVNQQLADLTIHSPITGYVTARSIDPGQIVSPGTAIVTVVDLRSVYYQPTISETDYRNIRPGQPVSVTVDAFPGRTFQGNVSTIFPTADQTARQFSVRVMVANPNDELRPGMYARGTVTTAVHHDVVVIPLTALVPRDATATSDAGSYGIATGGLGMAKQKVFLAGPDGKAKAKEVEVGILTEDKAEITSGLSGGESLVVKGQTSLRDGDPIKIVKGATGPAGAPV